MKSVWVCLLLLLSLVSEATSIVFPKFGTPIKQGNVLVFTSINAKRVIAVDLKGKKKWEKEFGQHVTLLEGPRAELWLQVGKEVFKLKAEDGDMVKLFELEVATVPLHYLGSVLFSQGYIDGIRIINPASGRTEWHSKDIDQVVQATPSNLYLLKRGKLLDQEKNENLDQSSLLAVNQTNFAVEWEVKLEGARPVVQSVIVPPYMVCAVGDKIQVLDLASGNEVNRIDLDHRAFGFGSNGMNIHYVSRMFQGDDFENTVHTLHFVSLPDLKEAKKTNFKINEVSRVEFWEDLIITDALYRVACFKNSGKKLWQKFQMNRTPVMEGKIYFSENHKDKTARVGVIDVATGKETILYKEVVPESRRVKF